MWKKCSNLPTKAGEGQAVVINGKVYFGGCLCDNEHLNHNDFCYDPSEDQWTMLPPLPDICFGLGQVNGNLVAVGIRYTEVHTYSESSREWKETIPPMPTGRLVPDVISVQAMLIVAGGVREDLSVTDAVEIFDARVSQWYIADSLPIACRTMSTVAIDDKCYVLGGYNKPSRLNQVHYASIITLLRNSKPAEQMVEATPSGRSNVQIQSAWQTLPATPTYKSSTAILVISFQLEEMRLQKEEPT